MQLHQNLFTTYFIMVSKTFYIDKKCIIRMFIIVRHLILAENKVKLF